MADTRHIEEVEAQAALYALGALPKEEAALFEKRLNAGCPVCLTEAQGSAQAAAALILSAPEVQPPPGLRARLLDRIGAPAATAAPKSEPAQTVPAGQTKMGEGILVRADDTDWKQSPMPGVEIRNLYRKKTMLVRMAPKSSLPPHDHGEAEQCLVLEGSITSDGVTARAGDFTYMPAGSKHQPLYSEEGCLLLITYT